MISAGHTGLPPQLGFQSDASYQFMEIRQNLYCPARGMGEKPSPLGEDVSLIFAKGFKDPRIQGFK
jgi:hypothetical protein